MRYTSFVILQMAIAWAKAASSGCSELCGKVEAIETSCSQPGTKLDSHAECMCKNNSADEHFFDAWRSCRKCLPDSASAESEQYVKTLDIASRGLCNGSPSSSFQALFSAAAEGRGLDVGFAAATTTTPTSAGIASTGSPMTKAQASTSAETASGSASRNPAASASPTGKSTSPGSAAAGKPMLGWLSASIGAIALLAW